MAGLSCFRTFIRTTTNLDKSVCKSKTAANFIIIHGKKLFKQTVFSDWLRYIIIR